MTCDCTGAHNQHQSPTNDLPVYVVGLPNAQERRSSVQSELANAGLSAHFIDAYNCHDPDFPFARHRELGAAFWGREGKFKPGAFGCYLSHADCWELVTKSQEPYALILEDDVGIHPQPLLNAFTKDSFNSIDFDIIFINQGGHRWCGLARACENGSLPVQSPAPDLATQENKSPFISVSSLLLRLVLGGTFRTKVQAVGSYGYLVSPRGAARLLAIMRTWRICMGVDYAMIFNTLSDEDVSTLREIDVSETPWNLQFFLSQRDNVLSATGNHPLKAYIYTPAAVVWHKDFPSTIQHEVWSSTNVFGF